jgi:anti-anti-sigma factor
MACYVLAAVETTAIGRMFGAKHVYRLDATHEFLAIGSANLLAGLGSAFPVSGGMSQSLVNETAGARTPLSGLVAAIITLLVAVFFTGLLRNLPQPVLAAIILVAVTGLVQVEALRHIWRFSRTEFAVAMAALLGVLGSGLLNGVLLGVAISLLLLLGRASRPRVTELGRVPGTTYYADLARHPENERADDVLVVRSEGALLYFNVDHVRDSLSALIDARPTPPRLIVYFMGNVPHVDMAGVEFLLDIAATCRKSGIEFRLAEVHGHVREALRRSGDAHAAGMAEAHQTVDAVLNKWRTGAVATS